MICAALLNDVVEDTPVRLPKIVMRFGRAVAVLVEALTDVSKPEDGNREIRKAMDRAHSAATRLRHRRSRWRTRSTTRAPLLGTIPTSRSSTCGRSACCSTC